MKNLFKVLGIIALVAIIGFSVVGCGGEEEDDNNPGGYEKPPSITTQTLPALKAGTPYSHTLTATGDTPITWSIGDGLVFPDGLTLSTAGVISGTPTMADFFNFKVKATNATGSDEKYFNVSVAGNGTGTAPTIDTTGLSEETGGGSTRFNLPDGQVGTAYSYTFSATGDTPIKWRFASTLSGRGFAGSTLSSEGVFSGTPPALENVEDVYSLSVTAVNAAGSVSEYYLLTIKE